MKKTHRYFVYIMTNKNNNVLYTGMTNDLQRRVWEHKTGSLGGFTERYRCKKLVWFNESNDVREAIAFEKKLKAGSRKKKLDLIAEMNPKWHDLAENWL